VVVRAGESRLAAFLVAEPGAELAITALRAGLKERLPDYMVPAAFATLAALPLTPSGKVDRRALSRLPLDVSHGLAGEERELAAPRNEVEAILAGIWAEVLGRERVGIHDNFFELGGDSILGIRLVARARKAGVRFSPRNLFQHQTIAALAAVAEAEPTEGSSTLRPTAFQRWLVAADPAAFERWNEAVLIALPAGVGVPALETALTALARRHAALRLRFHRADGGWTLATGEPEERIAIERIDLAGEPAALPALAEEARDRIDLAVRPWTATLFHPGGGEPDRLLFAVHRLAVDGPSWESLLDDLRSAALGELIGEPDAAPAVSRLPLAGVLSTELAEEESRTLLEEIAVRHGSSPEELLAAALVEAVARWGGARRVALEVEVRRVPGEIPPERAVGCFSAIVALQAEVGREPLAALKRIKDELRRTPETDRTPPEPEISLRWRGRLGSGEAGRRVQALGSRSTHRGHRTFEVVARLEAGRLRLEWGYTEGAHRPEAARALADATAAALRSLTGRREAPGTGVFTPSDFPAAGLSQEGLDDLLAELTLE